MRRTILLVLLLAVLAPRHASAQTYQTVTVSATFSWSVPARFGPDPDGDGLIEDHINSSFVNPERWPMDFDACAQVNGSPTQYTWQLDGVTFRTPDCRFHYDGFAAQRTYPVKLTLSNGRTVTQNVWIKDHLVVSIGDSLGSGEGVPNRFGSSPLWENRRCHRSSKAGSALAARALEDADPHSTVTFVHRACSGASITAGVLDSYSGIEPSSPALDPQVDQVNALIGGRKIDALMMSVGGNDIRFAGITYKCVVQYRCFDQGTTSWGYVKPWLDGACDGLGTQAERDVCHGTVNVIGASDDGVSAGLFFETRRTTLISRLQRLSSELHEKLDVEPSRVFLTEYHDPTRDETGAFCMRDYDDVWRTFPFMGFVAQEEWAWAGLTVLPALNSELKKEADEHGWRFVSGIRSAFRTGGYCAADGSRLTRRLDESIRFQGGYQGMIHPNTSGHQVIRDAYLGAVRPALGI